MAIKTVTIIGAGNLAWHLIKMLQENNFLIQHIAGRTPEKAEAMAAELNCSYSGITAELPQSDIYIISVKDDAIKEVAQKIYSEGKFIVHTSGGTASDVLQMNGNAFGVIWPMQTLVKGNALDYKKMLIAVSASDDATREKLGAFAKSISDHVEVVSDEQRAILHMTAVWVNNFTNHLFDIASDILAENNLKFDLMMPMISEMMEKVGTVDPEFLQTGPAKRGDMTTMEKHMQLLSNHPEWKQLYYELSRSIINKFIMQ